MKNKPKTGLAPLSELISLRNKRALITGSGTGIGEAIANRFAEAGADLELVDVNEERLNKVKEELEAVQCRNQHTQSRPVREKANGRSLEGTGGKKSQKYWLTTQGYTLPSLFWT
jgi:hypothetical protein